jgi:hydroxymethylbilane synthase
MKVNNMKMNKRKIIIATRGSKLALWQANWVKASLENGPEGLQAELKMIKTTGDKILDVPLARVGGKGLFVKEIEEALLRGEADIAVHSMKDVPAELPEGLHLAAICEREDPVDALVSRGGSSRFSELPHGAHIGTSSLRRRCQLLGKRPDLLISDLRGNLDTRLRKLDEGVYDAIVLAAAGLKRLGFEGRITEYLRSDTMLSAVGQGAVGIECREKDPFVNAILAPLNHPGTSTAVRAERGFLRRLEGGCQVPIAAYARVTKAGIELEGLVGSPEGDEIIRDHMAGALGEPEALGAALASELIKRGGGRILAAVYGRSAPGLDKDVAT